MVDINFSVFRCRLLEVSHFGSTFAEVFLQLVDKLLRWYLGDQEFKPGGSSLPGRL